jgi:putative hydrolase of the HAD superfamily
VIDWNRIDIVLLDMDGTLLDLHYDNTVWNGRLPVHYAQRHGLSTDDANAHLMGHMRRTYGSIEFYCLDHWARFTGIDILAPHREVTELIRWRPNALEFLRRSRARGVPVVMATNAHRDSIGIKDLHSGIIAEMDDIISAHDYGAAKEEQAFWQALARDHVFDPARALFVDDNAGVLDAARAFGIGQLLTIAQPDSARPPRTDLNYPVLTDFADIFPPND